MFLTLFKHEWKSNIKLFSLLSVCVIGIGCLSAVVLRLITTYWDLLISKDGPTLLLIPAFLFLFFAYLSVIIYIVGIFYIQIFRFYKTRFTEQGYLMFTLPVKTSHLYLSTALHILVWNAISILVIIATLGIAIGLGPDWSMTETDVWGIFWKEMQFAFSGVFGPGEILALIVCFLILVVYGTAMPLGAVVLGCTIAKKHKVLAIIGILYGISVISGIINGIISFVVTFLLLESASASMVPSLIASCVFPLILTVIAYPLSIHLMKNKLNLP